MEKMYKIPGLTVERKHANKASSPNVNLESNAFAMSSSNNENILDVDMGECGEEEPEEENSDVLVCSDLISAECISDKSTLSNQSQQFFNSEDDGEENESEEGADSGKHDTSDEFDNLPAPVTSIPRLPQGISIEKKKPTLPFQQKAAASAPTPIKLPPGISMAKRTGLGDPLILPYTPPVNRAVRSLVPTTSIPPKVPRVRNQRPVPPRSFRPSLPIFQQNRSFVPPIVRLPPRGQSVTNVQKPRPTKVKGPPAINRPGGRGMRQVRPSIGVDAHEFLQQLMQRPPLPPAPRLLRPVPPSRQIPTKLPPGVTFQQKKKIIDISIDESDGEDEPLQQQQLVKVPPSINVTKNTAKTRESEWSVNQFGNDDMNSDEEEAEEESISQATSPTGVPIPSLLGENAEKLLSSDEEVEGGKKELTPILTQLPQLPPGINIERKKSDVKQPVLKQGVDGQFGKTKPAITTALSQIPSGINIERKVGSTSERILPKSEARESLKPIPQQQVAEAKNAEVSFDEHSDDFEEDELVLKEPAASNRIGNVNKVIAAPKQGFPNSLGDPPKQRVTEKVGTCSPIIHSSGQINERSVEKLPQSLPPKPVSRFPSNISLPPGISLQLKKNNQPYHESTPATTIVDTKGTVQLPPSVLKSDGEPFVQEVTSSETEDFEEYADSYGEENDELVEEEEEEEEDGRGDWDESAKPMEISESTATTSSKSEIHPSGNDDNCVLIQDEGQCMDEEDVINEESDKQLPVDDQEFQEESTEEDADKDPEQDLNPRLDDPPEADEKTDDLDFEKLISSSVIKAELDDDPNVSSSCKQELDEMNNLVEMMTKGEIEGEMEEDEEPEKKACKRKALKGEVEDVSSKKIKEGDGSEDEEEEEDDDNQEELNNIDKSKVTGSHLRKNIREVMDETKLDEATLAAQRQEAERLKRLQDQQRIIREVQRQIQQNKQTAKMESKVMSFLQGNTQMSILKTSSAPKATSPPPTSASSTVSLKLSNGQQTNLSDKVRELLAGPGKSTSSLTQTDHKSLFDMVSSSVTIAPVKKEILEDKKKSVVTLSSDSDDDCIVLSEEEMESEPEEDPTNSGMHTTDKYNVTDEQGRVLVNVGHPSEDPDIFLAPQIARVIKPHQIGGVRFLYDNIIESLERYNNSPGFGCILAHSMGLGKTLQIVSFSDIFLRHTGAAKVLCIMPINTIQNWQAEFNMWVPKETTEADVRCRSFNIYIVNESLKNIHSRGKVILDWHVNGGVLLMGYELFRLLSLKKPIKSKKKRPDESEEERNRELVDQIYAALVKPGPDLVICDEGHRIKNSHATTSQALKQIRTRRRVVLTGYPLQNNLLEYWCMVDFVRPNYLGSKTEFSNMFERPIQNGQCIDSTPQDIRLMRYRAHVLHSLLEGFVQRRSHAVLQAVLPQKEEYVLLLRFTPFQKKLYDTFMNEVVRTVAVPNPLKAFAVCCKIWNHPDVLFNFLRKKGEQIDLDLEEALPPTGLPPRPLEFVGGVGTMGAPAGTPAPWPKRGPGSRGGKVRTPSKKKLQALAGAKLQPPLTQAQQDKAPPKEPALPSMSQFPMQTTSGYTSSSSSSFPSQNTFYPQQQPLSANYPYQQTNFDAPGFGNDQKSYNSQNENVFGNAQSQPADSQGMYGSNPISMSQSDQKMSLPDANQGMYGSGRIEQTDGSDYNAGFNSNFYHQQQQHGQQPYQQSTEKNSNYGAATNQYYPANEATPNPNYDFGQNQQNDYHMSGFRDGYDNPSSTPTSSGGASTNDFQDPMFWGNNWPSCGGGSGNYSGGSSGDEFMSPPKFNSPLGKEESYGKGGLDFGNGFSSQQSMSTPPTTPNKPDMEEKKDEIKLEAHKKEDTPYEWATELFKNYVTGLIENSSKMEVFFLILTESTLRQDRILVFSQSLLTLDLIEEYLQRRNVPGREENWARNKNYFRLDGSTPALDREKLINEFNANPYVLLFLVSTRAGSLGINLVGANRVIVFDASWNPCHDTQAVCRVYRYGQRKQCYVYRLVMDCCLEKKIYDRQINKQGMADRVVDELNPDAHLSIKEVTNLCWDDQDETSVKDFSNLKSKYRDDIIQKLVVERSFLLSKEPFQHESLLIDRKEKKLSQAEKRLAKRSYELEKQASNQPRGIYQLLPSSSGGRSLPKPIASVKPMQNERFGVMPPRSKWIPAEVWQKQGMSAQEMTLPLDVVIPTNSPDKTSIVLKAGQRVMVLKSPKGIYMQLETGKIIAIRTAFKVGQSADKPEDKKVTGSQITSALKNNPNVTITQKSSLVMRSKPPILKQSSLDKRAAAVNMAASKGRVAVTNKNRIIPPSRKLQVISQADRIKHLSGLIHDKADSSENSGNSMVMPPLSVEDTSKALTEIKQADDSTQPCEILPESKPEGLDGMPGGQSPIDANPHIALSSAENMSQPLSDDPLPQSQNTSHCSWGQENKISATTSQPSILTEDKPILPNLEKTENYDYGAGSGKTLQVKKEDDKGQNWPTKPGYPPDPYGNYYPGYYGFGPPMPGYEGYPPYPPRNYPPHMPIKQEKQEGTTPPPGPNPQAVAPPLYPPYPNPYPYPYNYPPYPPQAQPPAPTPPQAPVAPVKAGEGAEGAPYVPPYNHHPSYPSGPNPGFYPNYPPYRPYHDPNYPYPNYNPYMPYGYPPMQGTPPGMPPPHPPQSGDPNAPVTTPGAGYPQGNTPGTNVPASVPAAAPYSYGNTPPVNSMQPPSNVTGDDR